MGIKQHIMGIYYVQWNIMEHLLGIEYVQWEYNRTHNMNRI